MFGKYDTTFCVADCENKDKCERNPIDLKPFVPYSFADFSESCEKYIRKPVSSDVP